MTIGSVQVAPSSSDQLSLMSASSQTVGSGLNLQASQTTNTRECPPTLATSLFGYVATRKSLACRNPPNGIGFSSTKTTRSGPNVALPGAVSTRSLCTNVWPSQPSGGQSGSSGSSPMISDHVM